MTEVADRPAGVTAVSTGINREVPIPYYYQLEGILRQQVDSGRWTASQRVPSEKQLGELYNVSRTTVRQAVNNLVAGGLLYHVKGKGTFVRKHAE
jgi:GntR family transcriptional regulator